MTTKSRHALPAQVTTDAPIPQVRQQLRLQCPDLDDGTWWLLGTSGCHLCDIAESLIHQLQAVMPISYQNLDIVRLDEPTMETFASQIPVVLTPTKRLDYPFSVLDLQQLNPC